MESFKIENLSVTYPNRTDKALDDIKFTVNQNDHNEDTILIRVRSSPFFNSMFDYYRASRLFFDNQQIKNNCMNSFLKYLN